MDLASCVLVFGRLILERQGNDPPRAVIIIHVMRTGSSYSYCTPGINK